MAIRNQKQIVHFVRALLNILFICFQTTPAQDFDTSEEAEVYVAHLEEIEGLELHLNKASTTDLMDLPGMTPDLAWRISVFRPYVKVQDLRKIPGITKDIYDQITPYLTLNNTRQLQTHLTTRITRPTNHHNRINDLRVYQRFQIAVGEHVSGFLLTDRDPQEQWTDFATGHLQLRHKFGQITLGDLRPEMGQGLLQSRQTRSSVSTSTTRPRNGTRVANRSSTEYGAVRGIHVRTGLRALTLQALYGHVYWDAEFSENGFAEIRRTELHISETTQNRKHALTEKLLTFNMRMGSEQNHLGIAYQRTVFIPTKPAGTQKHHLSTYASLSSHNSQLFGEVAVHKNARALLVGFIWQNSGLHIRLLTRHYSPNFTVLHGAPIAAYGNPPQNEQGHFFGITYRPSSATRLALEFDRHKHLMPERNPLPDQGIRFRIRIEQRLGKTAHLQATHSIRKTRYDNPRTENRLNLRWRHRALQTTTWISRTSVSQSGQGFASGVRVHLGDTHKIGFWTTRYRISHYDARIYDFEPDVWGSGTLQTRSGNGQASGVLLTWATTPFRLSARYSFRQTNQEPATSWALQLDLRH